MEGYVFFLCRVFCWAYVKGGDVDGDGKAGRVLGGPADRSEIFRAFMAHIAPLRNMADEKESLKKAISQNKGEIKT